MLRLLVLLLLLANAAFFAWAKGSLAAFGLAPVAQSEPQRLEQQIRPEALRLHIPEAPPAPPDTDTAAPANSLPAASSPTSSLAAPLLAVSSNTSPASCLQAGLYNEEQTATLRSRLQSLLPADSWVIESSVEPARWLVYMGRYADKEALDKKKAELRMRQVAFPVQADAEAALVRISQQGVRTARIVQGSPELRGQRLKFSAADATLRAKLGGMKPALFGKPLLPCR